MSDHIPDPGLSATMRKALVYIADPDCVDRRPHDNTYRALRNRGITKPSAGRLTDDVTPYGEKVLAYYGMSKALEAWRAEKVRRAAEDAKS